jgi:multisubunit Na+/H+ antiporter MnhE subunit
VSFLRWWVISMALWLLLTSTVSGTEVITGLGASAVVALAAVAVRRRERVASVPAGRWAIIALRIPPRVAVDSGRLVVALFRRLAGDGVPGRFVELPMRRTRIAADRRTDEAMAAILTSVSPNAIVVEIDAGAGVALVHEVVPSRASTLDELMAGP